MRPIKTDSVAVDQRTKDSLRYCIPLTGHRHIQSAEKTFFNDFDLGDIPVVAVFTHFDVLENEQEFKLMKQHQRQHPGTVLPQDLQARAHAYAVQEYDEIHRRNLQDILGPHSGVEIQRVAMPEDGAYTVGGLLLTSKSVMIATHEDTDAATNAQGVNNLIRTTLEMLTRDGLRRLWVSAQQQSADLKRKGISNDDGMISLSNPSAESIVIAMQHFERVTITSSLPLIPFLGGSVFRSSFHEIFSDVSRQYGLIDPWHVLRDKATRKRIFGACLKLSSGGRIGAKAALAINILGPLTAPIITASLLKMIVGIIMIHEELFWKQREQNGLRLTEDVIEETCAKFAEGRRRRIAAAHIDGSIDISNYRREQYCMDVVTTALEAK